MRSIVSRRFARSAFISGDCDSGWCSPLSIRVPKYVKAPAVFGPRFSALSSSGSHPERARQRGTSTNPPTEIFAHCASQELSALLV
jgi:hypothetical protein